MSDILIPSAAFAPLTWYSLMSPASKIIIEAHETYPKQTFRNRYYIAGPQGVQALTIPVIKTKGNHSSIREIKIDYSSAWVRQHIGALKAGYENSPYFLYFKDYIFSLFQRQLPWLFDFNTEAFSMINQWLQWKKEIIVSNDFYRESGVMTDLRNDSPKHPLEADIRPYSQVFDEKFGYIKNLCILDLIFNKGLESSSILKATGI